VYEIKEYVTETDKNSFAEWFKGLRDKKVGNKVIVRVNSETLHRTLSKDGNSCLGTLYKVLGAMGLHIGISIQQPQACSQ
jgi:DNA-binding phage protein